MPVLFTTQTTSVTSSAQAFGIIIEPPGTYVAPFTVQSVTPTPVRSYTAFNVVVTPPSMPGGPSVITMSLEVPVTIRALDASATPFTITGRVLVPVSVSMVLPPSFVFGNLQILATLSAATATITSLTEILVSAQYTVCLNSFQTEMVSLSAGLSACACNGLPVTVGSV